MAAAALVCATCCAKEDYKDPQKFAEKYVREDIERKYPGEVFNPKQSAQADAEKEQATTQAKIDELKAKIAEETKAVEGVVQADVSARVEKLAAEIQTLTDELEKML